MKVDLRKSERGVEVERVIKVNWEDWEGEFV